MNKSRNYSNKKVKKFRKTKRRGGIFGSMKKMLPNSFVKSTTNESKQAVNSSLMSNKIAMPNQVVNASKPPLAIASPNKKNK